MSHLCVRQPHGALTVRSTESHRSRIVCHAHVDQARGGVQLKGRVASHRAQDLRVGCFRFRVSGLGFRVKGFRSRFWGLGFGVQGLSFEV